MAGRMVCVAFLTILLSASLRKAGAADPDPLRDFAEGVEEFVLRDVVKTTGVTGPGGIRADLPVSKFPALKSQGITVVRFKLFPCGENLPHTHPRATEILTMLSGGPLQVGFVDTSGNAHINILHPGDVTVFPRGMLHFELNVGTEDAEFLSSLNSENPGSLIAAQALFELPARALGVALNQPIKRLEQISKTLYAYDAPVVQKSTRAGCVPGKNIETDF